MAVRENVGADFGGTVEKASRGFVTDFTGPNGFVQPTNLRLTSDQAISFWEFNDWVNATVNRIVSDVTKIQPVVQVRNSQVPSERQKRRIRKVQALLENPNNNDESFSDIREKVIRDMLIIGRGAVEKVFDEDTDELSELYSLVAKNLKIRADSCGNIPENDAYKMERFRQIGLGGGVTSINDDRSANDAVYWDRNEVIFMVLRPVSWSLYGHKPLDTLANTVASDILRATYNSVFFTNNGESSGVISLEGMSKTELEKFKQYVQKQHKGAANAHRTMAVNVPVKWVQMAITNRDMQFQEYGGELRTRIFAVYSMQPIIMGVLDSSTGRLNSEQQTDAYKSGALAPIIRKESYYYSQHICWDGFGFDDLEIVFPDIDLLEPKAQSDIDKIDLEANVITVNEVRRRRKKPAVPWGDAPVNLDPGGGQIDPKTGKIEFPQKKETEVQPKLAEKKPAEKKPKPTAKKEAVDLYIEYMKLWCLKHYADWDLHMFRSLFGSEGYPNECKDLNSQAFCDMVYQKVYKCIEKESGGSLSDFHKKIDTIFNASIKSKIYLNIGQ